MHKVVIYRNVPIPRITHKTEARQSGVTARYVLYSRVAVNVFTFPRSWSVLQDAPLNERPARLQQMDEHKMFRKHHTDSSS